MRKLVVAACIAAVIGLAGGPATADQPGPGDSQCVPGHQGNPHPGFKAGVCDNK